MKYTTRTLMESTERIQLDGVNNDYTQPISDDQIINDAGRCIYAAYIVTLQDGAQYRISRRAMQRYANQW